MQVVLPSPYKQDNVLALIYIVIEQTKGGADKIYQLRNANPEYMNWMHGFERVEKQAAIETGNFIVNLSDRQYRHGLKRGRRKEHMTWAKTETKEF